jgi:hypothetical protein
MESRKIYTQDHAPTSFEFDKYTSQKPMTTPSSPSHSTPYRDGAFLKDLKQLKNLIQQTMEEYAACGPHDQLTSKKKDNETISNSEDSIEDFRKEVVEIAQLAEEKRIAEADEAGTVDHHYLYVCAQLLIVLDSLAGPTEPTKTHY